MEFSQLMSEVDSIFSRGGSLVEVHKALRDLHVFDRELSDKGFVDYSGQGVWSVRVFQNPIGYVLRRQMSWNGYNRVPCPDKLTLDEFLEHISLWSSQQAMGGEVAVGLETFFERVVASDGGLHFEGRLPFGNRSAGVYAILRYPPVSLDVRVGLAPVSQSKVA